MIKKKVVSKKSQEEPGKEVKEVSRSKGKLITIKEASSIYKYKISYIRKLIAKGTIPSYQKGVGCKIFIDQEEMDELIRRRHR